MTTYVGAALDEIGREMRKKKSASSEYVGWKQQPNQPRECYVCGKPVHLNQSVGFRSADPPLSWHFECAKGAPRMPL